MGTPNASKKFDRDMLVIVLGLFVVTAMPCVEAGSIWDRRKENSAFLFTDELASEVGDLLTVVVEDSSSFSQEAAQDMERSSGLDSSVSGSTGEESLFKSFELSEETSRSAEGNSDRTAERMFNDSIAVTVIDKLPNGNLVIGGRKTRTVAGEKIATMFTGIVQPEHIASDNTVDINTVGKARLYYETSGPADGFVRLGWLNRIINVIWPL